MCDPGVNAHVRLTCLVSRQKSLIDSFIESLKPGREKRSDQPIKVNLLLLGRIGLRV